MRNVVLARSLARSLPPCLCPLPVTRTEYQVLDIDLSDKNEDGAIASLLNTETGDTLNDLRIPVDEAEYKPILEASIENNDKGGKDVYITVLEAMTKRKVLPGFLTK